LVPEPFLEGRVLGYVGNDGLGRIILDMNAVLAHRAELLFLPLFWLPVSILVFLSQWRLYSAFDRLLIYGAGIYLLSFCILNQAASFRYMLPVFAIYTAYQIRFIGWLSGFLINKLRRSDGHPRKPPPS
jgi:hypothetical protein